MTRRKRGHDPTAAVDELLATDDRRWAGGQPCATCQHPRVEEIDRACQHLNEKRAAGETSYPWSTFLRNHLRPVYDYKPTAASLKRHLENCRGLTIA